MTGSDNTDVTAVHDTTSSADLTDVEGTSLDETAVEDITDDPEVASTSRYDLAQKVSRGVRARLGMLVIAIGFVAAASVTTWLYVFQYRVDRQTDIAAANAARAAASDGTIAILSYTPETLEKDFGAAKSRLTGNFLNYYTQFTDQIVTPAAKQKSVKTKATMVQAAIVEIKPDSAVALVFVDQTTTSKDNPDGALTASSIKVGLTKVNGAWLISSFDPV